MLLIAKSIKELNFSKLVYLYRVDVEKNRKMYYSHLEPNEGRLCAENDLYHYLRDVFFGQSKGVYYICEEQGVYLSALRLEGYEDGLLLNALVTDEDHRNKGYASVIFEEIRHSVSASVYSHIHRKNAASIGLHCKFGFEKHKDYAVLLDGTVSTDHITYILTD